MTLTLKQNGALLIDKPEGPTSFGIISQIRGCLKQTYSLKTKELPKLGHAGTLDPFATGLLVVLVGDATKLSPYITSSFKTYEGLIRFGESNQAGDPTEPISEFTQKIPKNLEEIQKNALSFENTPYDQIPPMHSAIQIDGKRLYELARQGKEIDRSPRRCKIKDFKILSYEQQESTFSVNCSAGTYVRVLVQDLAKQMDSLAYLKKLRRTQSGSLSIEKSVSLTEIKEQILSKTPFSKMSGWVDTSTLLENIPKIEISKKLSIDLAHGVQEGLAEVFNKISEQSSSLMQLHWNNKTIALIKKIENTWKLEKVFPFHVLER
ncbi:MAG: tRNA pseudouridine(55) synthase TruB [Bdellovibrionaceae bacterium]|nr:tRNA pseudouridine(55) synthase TruB [Pseudobdellovibrionaceae bacterium]|tara:strand:+ start:1696 stop:2658 length:963 start_codon:yes stop_codon:yes gene_type:complete